VDKDGAPATWHAPNASAAATSASHRAHARTSNGGWNGTYTCSAARSADGRTIVVRLSSRAATPVTVQIVLADHPCAPADHTPPDRPQEAPHAPCEASTYVASVLAASSLAAVNTAAQPLAVAPEQRPRVSLATPLELPPYSVAVVTITLTDV
jgi:hypothetical protein